MNIFQNQNLANIKVEVDLSNYATKADIKNETGVVTSDFAKKTDSTFKILRR